MKLSSRGITRIRMPAMRAMTGPMVRDRFMGISGEGAQLRQVRTVAVRRPWIAPRKVGVSLDPAVLLSIVGEGARYRNYARIPLASPILHSAGQRPLERNPKTLRGAL